MSVRGSLVASTVAAATIAALAVAPARADDSKRVDLNRATVEELCTLPGIGEKRAEAILALRERRPFTRVTQLLNVKGIGKRTLRRLRPHVYIDATTLTSVSPPRASRADE